MENNIVEVIDEREVLGKEFRIYGTMEEPLFLAKDVANWIEHSAVHMMVKTVEEDEKVRNNVSTLGGNQESWFLTEFGLYEVLMQSRKPIARTFKNKVKEIIRDVRKYGMYINDEFARAIIDSPQEAREEMLKYFNESQRLQGILKEYQEEIERLKQTEKDLIEAEKKLEFLQERPENNDWKKEANKRVRKLAPKITGFAKQNFGTAWNEVYREMYYSENTNIKLRHKRRIQRMKDDNIKQSDIDNTTILDTIGTDLEYVDMLFRVIDKLEERYEYKKEPTFPIKGNANERAKEFNRLLEEQYKDFY